MEEAGKGGASDRELDRTLIQPQEAQAASKDLSVPQDVEQHASAPRIAGYVLTQPVGQGAFAEVWKAWQVRTRKWVAVKVFTQRKGVNWVFLQREVERLIRLDKHPHIVSLLDADLAADPAYYVTDLLEGGSLERFVEKQSPAPLDKAVQWMSEIADALAYVHSKGLIHCDLKPANVLIDEQGHVRVADFGQSRVVTESAGALGTLFYMAPEQAVTEEEGGQLHPDVRWDVYALGATMYAITAGKVPWGKARADLDLAKSLKERLEIYRRAVRQDPPLDCRAATGGRADEDLSAIVARCAAVDPEDRYASVGDVRKDLEARRELRPVSPLAHDRVYRFKRFLQRNAALVVLGVAALAALAGAGTHIVQQNSQIRGELAHAYVLRGRSARDAGDVAAAAVYFAKGHALDPAGLRLAAVEARLCLRAIAVPERVFVHGGVVREAAVSPDGTRAASAGDSSVRLWDLGTGAEVSRGDTGVGNGWLMAKPVLTASMNAAFGVSFSPDSRTFASVQDTGDVLVSDAKTGAQVAKLQGWPGVYSPDGKLFAVGSVTGGSVQLYDASTWTRKGPPLPHKVPGKEYINYVRPSFSPDSRRLVTAAENHFIVWDAASGRRLLGPVSYEPAGMLALGIGVPEGAVFSPDGDLILAWYRSSGRLFDSRTGRTVGVPFHHDLDILDAVFAFGGAVFATASEDRTVQQWFGNGGGRRVLAGTSTPGSPHGRVLRLAGAVNMVRYSKDGSLLLTACQDGTAQLWDATALEPRGAAMFHAGGVQSAVFSADERRVVTASRDGTSRVWPVSSGPSRQKKWDLRASSVFFSPDRSRALGAEYDGTFRMLDLGSEEAGPVVDPRVGHINRAEFSRDGGTILLKGDGGKGGGFAARTIDARTGRPLGAIFRDSGHDDAALSPDGLQVLLTTEKGAQLWSPDGRLLAEFPEEKYLSDVSISFDGSLALLSKYDEARLWSVAGRIPAGPPVKLGQDEFIQGLSPDAGRFVVLERDKGMGRIIGSKDGRTLGTIQHQAEVRDAVFSPDGKRLATVSDDGTARLWDAWTGKPLSAPMPHPERVWAAAFSPDGELLATGCADYNARLWNGRTGEPLGPPISGGRGIIHPVAFTPDGRSLLTAGGSEVRRWDLGEALDPGDPGELLSRAEAASQRRLDGQGILESIPIEEWLRRSPAGR